jgi:hypothetical protein
MTYINITTAVGIPTTKIYIIHQTVVNIRTTSNTKKLSKTEAKKMYSKINDLGCIVNSRGI